MRGEEIVGIERGAATKGVATTSKEGCRLALRCLVVTQLADGRRSQPLRSDREQGDPEREKGLEAPDLTQGPIPCRNGETTQQGKGRAREATVAIQNEGGEIVARQARLLAIVAVLAGDRREDSGANTTGVALGLAKGDVDDHRRGGPVRRRDRQLRVKGSGRRVGGAPANALDQQVSLHSGARGVDSVADTCIAGVQVDAGGDDFEKGDNVVVRDKLATTELANKGVPHVGSEEGSAAAAWALATSDVPRDNGEAEAAGEGDAEVGVGE
jgi:hypothetical protein